MHKIYIFGILLIAILMVICGVISITVLLLDDFVAYWNHIVGYILMSMVMLFVCWILISCCINYICDLNGIINFEQFLFYYSFCDICNERGS